MVYWRNYGKVPYPEAISTALNVVEAEACFGGPEHSLNNRVAEWEGAIWYDLADTSWRAVRINRQGWEVVPRPPIQFRGYAHQNHQIEPQPGGDLRDLLRMVNISDEGEQLLFLVYTVSCIVPGIPHHTCTARAAGMR